MERREFMLASAAGLTANAWSKAAAAESRPRVGLIGCGWYGKCDLFRLLQVAPVEVTGLCDVDRVMLAAAAARVKQRQPSGNTPKVFGDYRQMLKEQPFDIVLVATPDHWHALSTIAAMEAGADVYVQKPISVDIAEGKAMLDAARRLGRVVQVGIQRRSTPHLIDARDRIIREGKLGKIGLVEIYCYYHMRARENPPDQDPPEHLDWDMWTGPAPMRPYNTLAHPRRWRAFMEYGNGIVGDMCIHMLDTVRWMLELGWPTRVSSSGGILVDRASKANITDTQTATFDFPQFPVVWTHRAWGNAPDPQYPWGATIHGDKGTLRLSVMSYDFQPFGKGDAIHRDVAYELEQFPIDKDEQDLERHVAPAIRAHMKDFLQAIATRGRPVADIEQGHISTASCILANMALKLGRSLTWDPAKHQVANDAEANSLLRRPYRSPWRHPQQS